MLFDNINETKYEMINKTMPMSKANKLGLFIGIPIFIVLLFIASSICTNVEFSFASFIVFYILGIVIHELIHGFIWSLYCDNGFKSIKLGFNMKSFNPYAHCKEAIPAGGYKIGTIMPTIIVGIIPYIIGLITNNYTLAFVAAALIVSGAGDALVISTIRKVKSDVLVCDHPTECGCAVFEKK